MYHNFGEGGFVCHHLIADSSLDKYYWFTGIGTAYNIVCSWCRSNLSDVAQYLEQASTEQFSTDRWFEGMIGTPEIRYRKELLHFTYTSVYLRPTPPSRLVAIKPIVTMGEYLWLGVLESATIIKINPENHSWQTLFSLSEDIFHFDFSDTGFTRIDAIPRWRRAGLHISRSERFVALTNDRSTSSKGVVVDLQENRVISRLDRRDYHPEQTSFPFSFFEHSGATLYVQATDWNRLDIFDAATGRLLTDRTLDHDVLGHYFDYFHGGLAVSPDNSWFADDGWVWQPVGIPCAWNLKNWFNNVWETDQDGPIADLVYREEWDYAICWVDATTLAIWGIGTGEMLPAVQLFDVLTRRRITWFAGPYSRYFFFDRFLFSSSDDNLSVWDIDTGEQLAHEFGFAPIAYHPKTKHLASISGANELQLAVLQ